MKDCGRDEVKIREFKPVKLRGTENIAIVEKFIKRPRFLKNTINLSFFYQIISLNLWFMVYSPVQVQNVSI